MSIISRSERSKLLEINSLEVKPKKTINPLVARALSEAEQLKLRPDINALKKRIAISHIKENESCFFSGYSGVKNEMIDFFYCLSGWLSEKSNDLNEVIKFQVNAIYECVKFNKITQDEKINSFFFSLKYLDGKDFKLIWESKLEIDQKEIKLFDVVFSKQEEKDAILMELAERNKLTLIELCSVFLFFKNSYNFRSRSELLKSEIFDAMNLALKKENINFLAIICNSELTQFNLKLNFLNWLYNRKLVTDMEKYFSNWTGLSDKKDLIN